jgi:hypothetical protein
VFIEFISVFRHSDINSYKERKKEIMNSQPNQLRADLLSVTGLNPFPGNNSSGRVCMFSNHIGQKLNIKGATERYIQTGMEAEFGKYTFSVKMPVDGRIIKVIDKHRKTIGPDSIKENPESIVIYEDEKTKQIGVISLPRYCTFHQYLGFEYKTRSGLNKLYPGQYIPEGTVFLDSHAVTDDGGYMYGLELNTAFISHPSVSEDGIMICEDVLPRLKFKTYETRIVEWGAKRFLCNMYGQPGVFKALPEIGELIRPDGILAVARTFEKNLAAAELSIYDLMEYDPNFDKCIFASPGGKVVDITVYHQSNGSELTLTGMEHQINRYDAAQKNFYTDIYREWKRLFSERGAALSITSEFHSLVVTSLAMMNETSQKINKTIRHTPLDDYYVKFVIETEVTPNLGFKLTDTQGGKGVITKIAKPCEMPVDQDGNRADIVMDGNSTLNRMNPSRLYEQYINACSRDVRKNICRHFNVTPEDKKLFSNLHLIANNQQALFENQWEYLLGYYKIISPLQYELFLVSTTEEKIIHFDKIVKEWPYLYLPINNQLYDEDDLPDMLNKLQASYRPCYGPVSYVGNSGNLVITEDNVRVGSMYFMLLEKIADMGSAVSSGKLQHFGIMSQITNADKYSHPIRLNPVKGVGETEGRILAAFCGPELVAEIMDRNNNPITHKNIVKNLLSAPDPFNIANLVNREINKLDGSKPIQLVNHIAQCSGWEYVYYSKKKNYTMTPTNIQIETIV